MKNAYSKRAARRPTVVRPRATSIIRPGWLWLVMLSLALPLLTRAQTYSIGWHKIAGGGGVSSNGQYVVSSTIGQSDAGGPMTGGSYSLTGGFWSLVAAVQTPGAPLLKIQWINATTLKVSWPSSAIGWSLQQNSDLSATGWAISPLTVTDDGSNRSVTVSAPLGNWFYRLSH